MGGERLRLPRGAAWPFLLVPLLLTPGGLSAPAIGHYEIDSTAYVTGVIDGDTFDSDFMGRVRLADIDAPEVGETGAAEATAYLTSLIHRQFVYLDIDDMYGNDRYGRVVAVVYVRHNGTHLLNVNAAHLRAGFVDAANYPNEFNPSQWSRYVVYEDDNPVGGVPAIGMAAGTVIVTAAVAIITIWGIHRMFRSRGGQRHRNRNG